MNTEKIYRGKLALHQLHSEGPEDILCLDKEVNFFVDEEDTLARLIENDMGQYGKYLSVSYYISDLPLEEDALITEWLNKLEGVGDARYGVAYSEVTGYLWTDEDLNVGGHNLLDELKSYQGKYLYLKICYWTGPHTGK